MSDARARAAELRPDLDIPWSNRLLMVPIFNVAAPIVLHPRVYFENGEASQALWGEHLESDAGTMANMSHPEHMDTVMMAGPAQSIPALRPMRYKTIITAKDSLRDMWWPVGAIVRNGGTSAVEREFEHPNETPEEKQARKERNLHDRDVGVTVLRAGGVNLKFPEGGTGRRVMLPDGTFEKIRRKKDEMLPLQKGFARIIDETPEEPRDRVRMMTIVTRYDRDKRFGLFRPTLVILDPVKPVEGDVEEVRLQGQELMARGFEMAIALDGQK